jgi:molecular chaperone DnaK
MTEFAIGIDLGTSTSAVCVYRNGEPIPIPDPITRVPIIPSIVAVNDRGTLLVGEEARSLVDRPGYGIREVKRLMGSGEKVTLGKTTYRPEEISALILRKLKQNAEKFLNSPVLDVVISVPANFSDSARSATRTAAELAGLNVLRLINEPTAAALAFGVQHLELDEQLVIFDFGGGTLDVSILEMFEGIIDVKRSFGNPELGGSNFDKVMIDLILGQFQSQNPGVEVKHQDVLKEKAELGKKSLSDSYEFNVIEPFFAFDGVKNIDLDCTIQRDEYEQACQRLLEQTEICLRQALTAKNIRLDKIDRVLLVGGSTYIPMVRRLVAEVTGQNPTGGVDPDLAVGLGACLQSALAQGLIDEAKGILLTDVSPFGLGIDTVGILGGQLKVLYEPLILPNTTIPYSVKKTYSLMHEEQDSVRIKLYQDHSGKAQLPIEAIDTGISAEITDIPASKDGKPHDIEVEFLYDINGIAHLKARIPSINKSIDLSYGHSDGRMTEEEKQAALERADRLWLENEKSRQYESLIYKAESFMSEIPAEERSPLSRAVLELKEALITNDDSSIQTAGETLVDLMFDLEN